MSEYRRNEHRNRYDDEPRRRSNSRSSRSSNSSRSSQIRARARYAAGEARDFSAEHYRARNSSERVRQERQVRDLRSEERSRREYSSNSGGAGSLPRVAIVAVIGLAIIIACIIGIRSCAGCSSTLSTDGAETTMAASEQQQDALPTPIIAESSGIYLHSAVAAGSLTEILIHNASYAYACEITTQLTEATNTEVMANHGTGRVASEQPTGDNWLTGEFIRCYRSGNAGPRMSAIDCGGAVGTTVYAPVSGKVVKVADYDLYNNANYPDIQIHIQPEGRSDLDVVLIHLTDASVKVGDTVTAGVTPIAKIRDVYAYIGDEMQLMQYTAEGDYGNHTHIQVNDATDPEYHGLD